MSRFLAGYETIRITQVSTGGLGICRGRGERAVRRMMGERGAVGVWDFGFRGRKQGWLCFLGGGYAEDYLCGFRKRGIGVERGV